MDSLLLFLTSFILVLNNTDRRIFMVYTFLVLDFDGTYDNEDTEDLGVCPSVYLIPLKDQVAAERCVRKAHIHFHKEESDSCLGDLFEDELKKENIFFQHIGDLCIPFGERQVDYLAKYLPREIV